MHELGITDSMLTVVLDHAKNNNVEKVLAIHLDIGELRDFAQEWIQHYFDYLSKNTLAEGAILKINKIPMGLKCNGCSHCFSVKIRQEKDIRCPQCGGAECSIVSGNEYRVKHIEVK